MQASAHIALNNSHLAATLVTYEQIPDEYEAIVGCAKQQLTLKTQINVEYDALVAVQRDQDLTTRRMPYENLVENGARCDMYGVDHLTFVDCCI